VVFYVQLGYLLSYMKYLLCGPSVILHSLAQSCCCISWICPIMIVNGQGTESVTNLESECHYNASLLNSSAKQVSCVGAWEP
jgi:hypothetical protein